MARELLCLAVGLMVGRYTLAWWNCISWISSKKDFSVNIEMRFSCLNVFWI